MIGIWERDSKSFCTGFAQLRIVGHNVSVPTPFALRIVSRQLMESPAGWGEVIATPSL